MLSANTDIYKFFLNVSPVTSFVPVCIGVRLRELHIVRPSGHYDHQWLHCTKGKGKLIIENSSFFISEGTGFLIRTNIPHEYYPVSEPWETHWITFNGKCADMYLDSIGFGKWEVLKADDLKVLEKCFHELLNINEEIDSSLQKWIDESNLYKLLVYIKRQMTPFGESVSSSLLLKMHSVIEFITSNYSNNNLSLTDIANCAKLSTEYFCRVFKKAFDIGPCEYLTLYRLQKAKEIIFSQPETHIKDVAALVGFSSVNYFISTFKRHFNETPNEFKKIQSGVVKK